MSQSSQQIEPKNEQSADSTLTNQPKAFCFSCLAKAGFAVALAGNILSNANYLLPAISGIFCLAALLNYKKETKPVKRKILVALSVIGLILAIILVIRYKYFYR